MKKLYIFLFTLFVFAVPQGSFALTEIDVETEGNALEWLNNATGMESVGNGIAAGDINGDGIDDVVITNPFYDIAADQNEGRVYLIYGTTNISTSPFDENALNSAVVFTGETVGDSFGTSIEVTDINGDGFDDIFIGATGYGGDGAVYLVYGQSTLLTSMNASDIAFKRFDGQVSIGYVGHTLAGNGDVNGDGIDDILVGATSYGTTCPMGDPFCSAGPGAVYLILGESGTEPFQDGSFDSFDVKYNGIENFDYTGSGLAINGDVNADGFDDIVIGANESGTDASDTGGKVFLIYGSSGTGVSPTTTALASGAITLTGEVAADAAGSSVTFVDLNNDDFDDIVIGAPGNDDSFSSSGAIYIVYGQSSAISSGSLSSRPQFTGSRTSGAMGTSVLGGRNLTPDNNGDLNKDGIQDLIIGTISGPGATGGEAHIVYGSNTQETSGTITDKAAFVFDSLVDNHSNFFGSSFALSDINNDAFTDILIGAPGTGPSKGAVYTFFQRFDSDDDGYDSDQNYVLFSGTDCDDTNIAAYTNYTFHQDADNDNSGTGATQVLCQGSSPSAPGGYRTSVANTTDCNDADGTVSANQTYYQDADNDTIGSGATELICSITPSAGYRLSVTGSNDCNDSDAAVSTNQTYYQDADNDTIGSGNTETICSATPSSGYRVSVAGTNDCNDADGTITTNQTYYSDTDDDGLGSNDALLSCTTTAPENYVSNSNDTNDSIANNGIEVSGDAIDNDNDGVIDEVNTLANNGAHPAYKNLSITSTDDYNTAIQSVNPLARGQIRVVFKDGSTYDYTIFTTTTSKKTLYKIIKNSGRVIAVSENGKQIRTVNLFTGGIIDTKTGIKSKTKLTTHTLLLQDIRNDGNLELLITSSDKKKNAYLTLTRIAQSSSMTVKARAEVKGFVVDTKKTKVTKTTIQLRNSARKVLKSFTVTKLYELKNPK